MWRGVKGRFSETNQEGTLASVLVVELERSSHILDAFEGRAESICWWMWCEVWERRRCAGEGAPHALGVSRDGGGPGLLQAPWALPGHSAGRRSWRLVVWESLSTKFFILEWFLSCWTGSCPAGAVTSFPLVTPQPASLALAYCWPQNGQGLEVTAEPQMDAQFRR